MFLNASAGRLLPPASYPVPQSHTAAPFTALETKLSLCYYYYRPEHPCARVKRHTMTQKACAPVNPRPLSCYADKKDYVMAPYGATGCPSGFEMTTDQGECEAGAKNAVPQLGLSWVWPSNDRTFPYGGLACVYFNSSGVHAAGRYDGDVYFNPNYPTISPSTDKAYAAPICKKKSQG